MLRSRIIRGIACLLTALLLITALPSRSLAASVYNVQATTSYTYIYKSASTSSTHLRKVTKGSVMLCGIAKGNWAYVKYDGVIGYVRTSDIKAVSASTSQNTGKTVESDGASAAQPTETTQTETTPGTGTTTVRTTAVVKLYKAMSTASGYYGTIPKNKTFTCLSIDGKWALVQVGKYKGYVLTGGLTTIGGSAPTQTAPSSSATTTPTVETVDVSKVKGVSCYSKATTQLYCAASTSAAAIGTLNIGDKIIVTHAKSSWCRVVTAEGKVGYLPASVVSKTKVYVNGSVVLSDWFTGDIQSNFKVGSNVTVTDVLTRQTFHVHRRGGIYHADCEPLTKADTAIILGLYGGSTSWARRAVWVTANGVTYAASMNFMNHGEQTIYTNGFNGHFCIHFYNSRTHGTNNIDPDHQSAIKLAFTTKP